MESILLARLVLNLSSIVRFFERGCPTHSVVATGQTRLCRHRPGPLNVGGPGLSRCAGVVSDAVINSWLTRQLRQSQSGLPGALHRVSGQQYADSIWLRLEPGPTLGPERSCAGGPFLQKRIKTAVRSGRPGNLFRLPGLQYRSNLNRWQGQVAIGGSCGRIQIRGMSDQSSALRVRVVVIESIQSSKRPPSIWKTNMFSHGLPR